MLTYANIGEGHSKRLVIDKPNAYYKKMKPFKISMNLQNFENHYSSHCLNSHHLRINATMRKTTLNWRQR